MNKKLNSMWRVGLALVLALSLSLVMAVPVSADVSSTVAVDPPTINAAAEYTVTITTTQDLAVTADDDIRIEFPDGTTVPAAYVNNSISINDTDVDTDVAGIDVGIVGNKFTIDVPEDVVTGEAAAVVIFKEAAGIVNPSTAAEDYTLFVSTSREVDSVPSGAYAITAPTITELQPDSGNMGDIMWVEVTGENFVGDAATNASDTVINFGEGIEVLDSKYIGTEEIDCQIRIDAVGTPTVIAIAGGTGVDFTANATDTPQVDVWDTYDITDAIFEVGTLVWTATETTIGDAIGSADADDTLIAHAATYEEQVSIDVSLTLAGAGAETTTIKAPASMTTVDVEGTQAIQGVVNVIGSGEDVITVDISGFTVDNNYQAPENSSIWFAGIVYSNADGTIEDNVITKVRQETLGVDAASWKGHGIWIGDASIVIVDENNFSEWQRNAIYVHFSEATATITNNIITGMDTSPSVCNGIVFEGATDGTVSGNTITGCIFTGTDWGNDFYDGWQACGIMSYEGYGTFTVDDNTVRGNDMGIYSRLTSGKGVITNNTVEDNLYFGIVFRMGDVEATGNTISGSEVGILVPSTGPWDSATLTANYNDIAGNTVYGIRNDSTQTVDAEYNYWGEIGGPGYDAEAEVADQSDALGNGDIVSKDVTYNPWLSVSYETVVDEGIRFYGSDTLTLQEGWNTLSVPVALYDLANSITEIELMGDFLVTDENYSGVTYRYDSVDGWLEPTTLIPCEGYYIKMLEDSNFPVLYSNSLGLPALELTAGWNLIGSAFGIDKLGENGDATWAVDDPENPDEATMDMAVALDSIGDQVSVVISPSAPGQIGDPWSEIWSEAATNDMYTGEGYWVFMTDTGTLAGWEITPFYFEPGTMPDPAP